MKNLIFGIISLSLFIIGCHPDVNKTSDSAYELDSIDYVVISSAINQFFFYPDTLLHRFHNSYDSLTAADMSLKHADIKMLLIIDSTNLHGNSISEYIHKLHCKIHKSDSLLTQRINKENKHSFKINTDRISSIKTQLISKNEIELLLDSVKYYGYDKLYNRYPTAYGIITLSKPAYNDNTDKAIIYVGFSKDQKWGQGAYLWLKKSYDKWTAYDIIYIQTS